MIPFFSFCSDPKPVCSLRRGWGRMTLGPAPTRKSWARRRASTPAGDLAQRQVPGPKVQSSSSWAPVSNTSEWFNLQAETSVWRVWPGGLDSTSCTTHLRVPGEVTWRMSDIITADMTSCVRHVTSRVASAETSDYSGSSDWWHHPLDKGFSVGMTTDSVSLTSVFLKVSISLTPRWRPWVSNLHWPPSRAAGRPPSLEQMMWFFFLLHWTFGPINHLPAVNEQSIKQKSKHHGPAAQEDAGLISSSAC